MKSTFDGSKPTVYVVNRLPWPLDDGWKRRAFAILCGVARSTRVIVVSPRPIADELAVAFLEAAVGRIELHLAPASPLPSTAATLVGSVASGRSPLSTRHFSDGLQQALLEVVRAESPSAIIYACTFMAERHSEHAALRSIPFIVDTHNIDSFAISRASATQSLPNRIVGLTLAALMRRAERIVFASAQTVFVCSEVEVDQVRSLASNATIAVVPNGVDERYFRSEPINPRKEQLKLLFFGKLDYPPNVDAIGYFAREIYPMLEERSVPFQLDIVGSGEVEQVRGLTANLPRINLVGRVDDISHCLRESDAVVVPLRNGGGTRLKVLEALASARPLISTALGAEGIKVSNGVHFYSADSASEIADAVESVWKNPAQAQRIATAGSKLIRDRYSWAAIQLELERALMS